MELRTISPRYSATSESWGMLRRAKMPHPWIPDLPNDSRDCSAALLCRSFSCTRPSCVRSRLMMACWLAAAAAAAAAASLFTPGTSAPVLDPLMPFASGAWGVEAREGGRDDGGGAGGASNPGSVFTTTGCCSCCAAACWSPIPFASTFTATCCCCCCCMSGVPASVLSGAAPPAAATAAAAAAAACGSLDADGSPTALRAARAASALTASALMAACASSAAAASCAASNSAGSHMRPCGISHSLCRRIPATTCGTARMYARLPKRGPGPPRPKGGGIKPRPPKPIPASPCGRNCGGWLVPAPLPAACSAATAAAMVGSRGGRVPAPRPCLQMMHMQP
mmetsp:Transcript_7835/g.20864  ORF Transcript_7835/g.20864 Transcript_7835/m.20864 type:complete len:338 (+) Transcript_7835:893-1906(+)